MKIFLIFFIVFFVVLIILNRKLFNPYKLYIIVGNKGTGKSAYMTHLAYKYHKKGYKVYTNYGIFNQLKNDYYNYNYPENSILFIDEVGLIHDNRNFKAFPAACTEFYKYQRKNKLIIYLASQTIDIDKKIRDLADYHILLRRFLPFVFPLYYHRIFKVEKQLDTGGLEIIDTLTSSLIPIKIGDVFLLNSVTGKYDTLYRITNISPNQKEPQVPDKS